jgi:hypothetical protein
MSYQQAAFSEGILRLEDGALIPVDPGNADYQAYQAWLAEGNSPQPAESGSPLPDYWAFWEHLLGTSAYQAIGQQAAASLPMNTAVTEFVALISDAKAGRPQVPAIQACINGILGLGTFTVAEVRGFQRALEAGHLEAIYTLPAA